MNKTLYSEQQQIFLAQLRTSRERTGLTQAEVARQLGMQQSDISKCERGVRRLDVVELRSWLEALGISLVSFSAELDASLANAIVRNQQHRGRRTTPRSS